MQNWVWLEDKTWCNAGWEGNRDPPVWYKKCKENHLQNYLWVNEAENPSCSGPALTADGLLQCISRTSVRFLFFNFISSYVTRFPRQKPTDIRVPFIWMGDLHRSSLHRGFLPPRISNPKCGGEKSDMSFIWCGFCDGQPRHWLAPWK